MDAQKVSFASTIPGKVPQALLQSVIPRTGFRASESWLSMEKDLRNPTK